MPSQPVRHHNPVLMGRRRFSPDAVSNMRDVGDVSERGFSPLNLHDEGSWRARHPVGRLEPHAVDVEQWNVLNAAAALYEETLVRECDVGVDPSEERPQDPAQHRPPPADRYERQQGLGDQTPGTSEVSGARGESAQHRADDRNKQESPGDGHECARVAAGSDHSFFARV